MRTCRLVWDRLAYWWRSHPWREAYGSIVENCPVEAIRRGPGYARKLPGSLPCLAVDRASLDHSPTIRIPTAVCGVLVCHLSCSCLARPVPLRRTRGGFCSTSSLCPGRTRFCRIVSRTALHQRGVARLSRVYAREVPHHAG